MGLKIETEVNRPDMFGFDDKYAMFDITPVQNQFIAEYMPHANGNYVKVWLYGLMQCYHPREDMDLGTMAQELEMTEEEVLTAFRYWERRGLVTRISDKPPQFRYVNMNRMTAPPQDTAFEAFGEDLYALFGKSRRLHGNELSLCYEWVEELGLPEAVVIMLIKHMISQKGKNFSIRSAEPLAVRMAEAKVRTVEDAERILSVDKKVADGVAQTLRRLGKRRLASDDEVALYRKWVEEWGFTQDGIEAACAETVKGEPTFGYLDGILKKLHNRDGGTGKGDAKDVNAALGASAPLKELLGILGRGSVNEETLRLYAEMREIYGDEVIRLAGRECATKGKHIEDVKSLLLSWKKRGLGTEAEVQTYITRFREQSRLLAELYEGWGLRGRGTAADRSLTDKWEQELGFSGELIRYAATFAAGKEAPMAYLDSILRSYAEKGIRTREAMEEDHKAHVEAVSREGAGKRQNAGGTPNLAQQFTQRTYKDETNELIQQMMEWEEDADA